MASGLAVKWRLPRDDLLKSAQGVSRVFVPSSCAYNKQNAKQSYLG